MYVVEGRYVGTSDSLALGTSADLTQIDNLHFDLPRSGVSIRFRILLFDLPTLEIFSQDPASPLSLRQFLPRKACISVEQLLS